MAAAAGAAEPKRLARRLARPAARLAQISPRGRLGTRSAGWTLITGSHNQEVPMNWDQVQGSWKQFKGQVKQKWGDLTDDEIDRVEGRQEELSGLIQKKYGRTREEADREVNEWAGTLR
jgi:uncharacterized protein YjbJ (UPF0337 family)